LHISQDILSHKPIIDALCPRDYLFPKLVGKTALFLLCENMAYSTTANKALLVECLEKLVKKGADPNFSNGGVTCGQLVRLALINGQNDSTRLRVPGELLVEINFRGSVRIGVPNNIQCTIAQKIAYIKNIISDIGKRLSVDKSTLTFGIENWSYEKIDRFLSEESKQYIITDYMDRDSIRMIINN
jgi:hypothetical protein